MENEHINLVKKWLANPHSVTQDELDRNAVVAQDAWFAVYDPFVFDAHDEDAAYFSAAAAWSAKKQWDDMARIWVKRFEDIENNENFTGEAE